MNIIWNMGEMAVSWMFPQVGVPLKAYRWGMTAYRVCKVWSGFMTGDVTVVGDIAQLAAKVTSANTCDNVLEGCLAIPTGGEGITDGGPFKDISCWAAFLVCKFFEGKKSG